jgi:hypothetical protein
MASWTTIVDTGSPSAVGGEATLGDTQASAIVAGDTGSW